MLIIVLVQIHFIQCKQFNVTNLTIHTSDFKDFFWMFPRATENSVAGNVWPAGY